MRKKASVFYEDPGITVKQLLVTLKQQNQNKVTNSVDRILNSRKKKLRQLRKLKHSNILQESFKPSKSIKIFSHQSPISSGEKFLLEKHRRNILVPDKINNSQPNMKAGSALEQLFSSPRPQDKEVQNKKFAEYIRVIDEQSGWKKKERLEEKKMGKKHSQPIQTRMKKTYFKKYPSDRFNFYQPPVTEIKRIFDLTSLNPPSQINFSRKVSQKYANIESSNISTLNSDRNTIRMNSQSLQ